MTAVVPAEVAPTVPDWTTLAELVAGCTVCAELAATRTRTVPGVLPSMPAGAARLMLVGEAPGATEDEVGLPFVGRSGELLDRLLAEAGTDRAQVAIANVLKCRPPGNRSPRRGEIQACRPWLERQLELAQPDVVVALGTTAVTWFFGTDARIGALRGELFVREEYRLLATYHPSAALRFGPNGAPMAAMREDLAHAVRVLADVEAAR
jgi:DNA polymerase